MQTNLPRAAALLLSRITLTFVATPFLLGTAAQAQEAPSLPGAQLAQELSEAFEQVAETITPSVVTISTETKPKKSKPGKTPDALRDFLGEDFMDKMVPSPQRGLGTGVIVDDQGHILTNNHVIGEADEVTVRLNSERTVKARVVGVDPRTDLAVIRIKVKENLPKFAKLGDSDKLKIGEWVVAAGASFGLDNTITAGIVSAKGRAISGNGQYEDFIQTDAAINPGNSGGALVDIHGNLMGINTAIYSRSGGSMGIGFAIPVQTARQVLEGLVKDGQVTRGWIGVEPQNLSAELAQNFGLPMREAVVVTGVLQNGPAFRAGIKPGDAIVGVAGAPVTNVSELLGAVAALKPGEPAKFNVLRTDREMEISVTPALRPKPHAQKPR